VGIGARLLRVNVARAAAAEGVGGRIRVWLCSSVNRGVLIGDIGVVSLAHKLCGTLAGVNDQRARIELAV
jgi:hypothetical protein